MKFRFCGGLDCPDWLVAEIGTLSKLTSIKIKLITVQVAKEILGGQIDYEQVLKHSADAKFELSEVKAAVAALCFILTNSAKHRVDTQALNDELQQLGLPKESVASICKVYTENSEPILEQLKKQSVRLTQLESVDWKIDHKICSNTENSSGGAEVNLCLNVRQPDNSTNHVQFSMDPAKLQLFLYELKQIQGALERIKT